MAVRWHTVFAVSWEPRKPYGGLPAPLGRSHGALTAAVRQTCGSFNNHEGAVRSPHGLLAVTLQFLISWMARSPCVRRNICDHNYHSPEKPYDFYKWHFTNRRLQNPTATVRRQHMWPMHYYATNLYQWMQYIKPGHWYLSALASDI